jgi:hypothetical protein
MRYDRRFLNVLDIMYKHIADEDDEFIESQR